MQHTRPHNRRDFQKQAGVRPSVDGFTPRSAPIDYQRRSKEILPGNDTEYMISLGSRASRRNEQLNATPTIREFILKKIHKISQSINFQNLLNQSSLLAVIGITTLVLLVGFTITKSVNPVTADKDGQQMLQDNGDTPNDKLVYNQLGYSTAPDLPKTLTIRKLGVNSRVTRLSVRENSEPKFPGNIYDVGWYENSAKPGEEGASLLIGHVKGSEKSGVFHDLTSLVPGDEFQVELGDGTIKNYYIVKMEAYKRNSADIDSLTKSIMPGKPGLNLLTAVGAFESNSDVVQQLGVFAVEKITAAQN